MTSAGYLTRNDDVASTVDAPPVDRDTRLPHAKRSVVLTAAMFAVSIYFLGPMFWLIVASTKTRTDLFQTFGWWFAPRTSIGTVARELFTRDQYVFVRWLVNSAIYSFVGAGVATLLAGACGYALAKYRFRGRELIFGIVLGGVLVPGTAIAIPLFLLMTKAHLTNTYWAVLLPSMVSPFGVYLSRIYAAAAVPDEIIEAARADGCSELRIFATFGLRLMSPGLVTVFLFQFVAIWNNFLLPLLMLSNPRTFPVTLGLFSWNSQIEHYPGYLALVVLGAAVSILPLALAFVSLQRFWRSDLAGGSVKG